MVVVEAPRGRGEGEVGHAVALCAAELGVGATLNQVEGRHGEGDLDLEHDGHRRRVRKATGRGYRRNGKIYPKVAEPKRM